MSNNSRFWVVLSFTLILTFIICLQTPVDAAVDANDTLIPLWGYALILFVVSFLLGMMAVLGGVGGAVLFVPITSGFFPFHFDFVRGGGLLIALSGALAASPSLLANGMANLRLAMPIALIASIFSIIGAIIGFMLPSNIIQIALGSSIIAIVLIMINTRNYANPTVKKPDSLSTSLGFFGVYKEESTGQDIHWMAHRTPQGIAIFSVVGLLAGMFGLGAGWANVPVLNLIMGIPIKISVATSKFIISVTDTSAVWIYFHNGAIFPPIIVPSVLGMMLGTRVGVNLLKKIRPLYIRYFVICILFFSGLKILFKGLGY